jgi:hypothetical protein
MIEKLSILSRSDQKKTPRVSEFLDIWFMFSDGSLSATPRQR